MFTLFASLLPLVLAAAMSAVPFSITIMILLSPNSHRGALPFLIGSLTGCVIFVGLAAIGLQALPIGRAAAQNVQLAIVGFSIALILVAYGTYLLRRKSKNNNQMLDKIRAKVSSARAWEFLVLGLALNLRPKAILLSVTAGALIGIQGMQLLAGSLFVVGYAVGAQSAILVPVALRMRHPGRADVLLTTVDTWMQTNSRTIAAATVLAVGLVIAGFSISQLQVSA